MNPNSVTVTLTLKIATHFLHMTLWLIMIYHPTRFGYKSFSYSDYIQTNINWNFKLGCDTDLEHSNPIFSLDTSLLMMIYHQIEFGCKRLTGLELIKDLVETVTFWLYKPSPHCDLDLEDRIPFFRITFWLMVVHHNTKDGYKRLHTLSRVGTNMCHKRYIPHPWRHHSAFPFVVK